jgi:acyl-CoA synthetase (AMP-forming)/AMP-acid ligase II
MMQINFKDILENGITIYSSGTSGEPKPYFQTPDKLVISSRIAAVAQGIRSFSKVYTCCKTTHAGGLLAQTLPALAVGAQVDIVNFSAYDFVRDIKNYTHTHITPKHARAIMLTKGFWDLNLDGVFITCGADPVTRDIIEAFVSRGAKFMANWGMSEVGPVAINIVFEDLDEVEYLKKSAPDNSTIMGRNKHCHYKIVDGELFVKGDICIYDGWYPTQDRVVVQNDILYYIGRTNKEIDIWNPQKG